MSPARCPDCLRQFATKHGLSIHRRSAHPEEYHLENVHKGVRKCPASKELLRTLTTSIGTQDGASSLLSEGSSLGSETQLPSSEEWTRDQASDLKKAVEESGINLDGHRLDDIEPGVPSDWVREAIDSNYEAWLPAPAAQAPVKQPEGARVNKRAQYARVQRCNDKDCTRCAQQVIAGNWRKPPPSLPMSVQEPFWRDLFETPPSLILGRFTLLGSYTGNCYIQLHRRMW